MATEIDDDLFTSEAIADPHTYFARLREEDPVHWNELYQVWIVTRHDDVVWLTGRPELFSSAVWKTDPRPPYPAIDESDMGLYQSVRSFFADWFIQHDRPEHTAMRRVLHSYFTPRSSEMWRPLVRSAIDDVLDGVEDEGFMDVMRDVATPLPVMVIARMMGLPYEDRQFMRELSENLIFIGRGDVDRMHSISKAIQGLIEYLSPLVEERIADPGDDLISVLARGEASGTFNRDQVLANAILLLLAGHETTINLICNGTLAFLQHREQWELLGRDPAGAVRATEECLRFEPPVRSLQRIASEDVEMRGKTIRRLDRMRWVISSANRDPEAFEEPDAFHIRRHPNRHVAFGSGIHHCLGATLARIEGQETFKALVQRFPSLRLETEELEYQPSITFRSLKSLPVSWT